MCSRKCNFADIFFIYLIVTKLLKLFDMTKPPLGKVEALLYVLQHVTKRGCARIMTHPLFNENVCLELVVLAVKIDVLHDVVDGLLAHVELQGAVVQHRGKCRINLRPVVVQIDLGIDEG